MTKFGDFQAEVGKVSSSIGLIFAYIFGGIAVLIAIGIAIWSFIPTKAEWETCVGDDCEKHKDEEKKRHPVMLLASLGLIIFAALIIGFSYWWNKLVHTNRTAAQIGGTAAEINWARSLMRN